VSDAQLHAGAAHGSLDGAHRDGQPDRRGAKTAAEFISRCSAISPVSTPATENTRTLSIHRRPDECEERVMTTLTFEKPPMILQAVLHHCDGHRDCETGR
jgi:hypothetical protein